MFHWEADFFLFEKDIQEFPSLQELIWYYQLGLSVARCWPGTHS